MLGPSNQLLLSELDLLEVLILSVVMARAMADIGRFRGDKKLCAYVGLAPSNHASGGKVFHSRITKQGNR